MTISKWALCATIMSYFAQPVAAQSGMPLNFPPSSFEGRQFVDNSGCVFVRAGYDGATTWVPRMTRSREQICGQTPTFGAATAEAAQPARTGSEPEQITLAPAAAAPAPAPTRVAAAPARPAPQPLVRRSAASTPTPTPMPTAQVVKAPASKPIAAEPPRMVRRVPATTAPVRIATQEACAAGQSYRMVGNRRFDVRCGPQPGAHGAIFSDAPAVAVAAPVEHATPVDTALAPHTRIVPRHVYEQRDTQFAAVPEGYKPAWDDDRLNPYRAVMTVQGVMETQQHWTNQVPRRLISQANRHTPFPRNLWTKKYRHSVEEPQIAYHAGEGYPAEHVRSAYADQAQFRTAVLSTKGTAGKAYVEIGHFTTAAKAQAATARLAQAGLGVRASTVSHQGQNMTRLRVGPFASAASAASALAAVKSAGYAQAYIR